MALLSLANKPNRLYLKPGHKSNEDPPAAVLKLGSILLTADLTIMHFFFQSETCPTQFIYSHGQFVFSCVLPVVSFS